MSILLTPTPRRPPRRRSARLSASYRILLLLHSSGLSPLFGLGGSRFFRPPRQVMLHSQPEIDSPAGQAPWQAAGDRGPRQNRSLARAGAIVGEDCRALGCWGGHRIPRRSGIRQKPLCRRARKCLRCRSRLSSSAPATNKCSWKSRKHSR